MQTLRQMSARGLTGSGQLPEYIQLGDFPTKQPLELITSNYMLLNVYKAMDVFSGIMNNTARDSLRRPISINMIIIED